MQPAMAILNYMSPSSSRTTIRPISAESSSSPSPSPSSVPPPSRPPTKILLPKKKPLKWSTGVAPGEYGGPPLTSGIPKVWGGEEEDPLTSDDYMWNKDFMGRMKRLLQDDPPPQPTPTKDEAGFLSLNRVMTLDSVEVDLSRELMKSPRPALEQPVEAATKEHSSMSKKWKLVPTRREQEKWDKATKAATGGSDVMLREVRMPRGDPKVLAAQSREQYYKLKNKLQFLTLGIGGIGLASAYVSYSPETAASFGAGLIGSVVYMRMLGNSVDSMGEGAKGLVKGAVGQPRLLVPVVLVMIYNRWNAILVPDYGFMQLELIPMLVGFFTYKLATFAQAMEDALAGFARKTED